MSNAVAHPTYRELLASRRGESVPESTVVHVAWCAICRETALALDAEPPEMDDASWLDERPETLSAAAIERIVSEVHVATVAVPASGRAVRRSADVARQQRPRLVRSLRWAAAPASLAAAALFVVHVYRSGPGVAVPNGGGAEERPVSSPYVTLSRPHAGTQGSPAPQPASAEPQSGVPPRAGGSPDLGSGVGGGAHIATTPKRPAALGADTR